MLSLLAPLGLAALAALAVPVLLHLVRRIEERRVDFAALRWLPQRTRPRERLRLHERLLLALRLLLLATLALLLALPVWRQAGEPGQRRVLVAPGLDAAAARAAAPDWASAQWHRLEPGFPLLDAAAPRTAASLPSLLRQLDAELPAATALSVLVPEELGGLDAERLRLGRSIDWRILPGRSADAPAESFAAPLRIALRHDAAGAAEAVAARALVAAWQAQGRAISLEAAPLDAPLPADAQWLFWFGGALTAEARAWIAQGRVALASRQPAPGAAVVLADELGQPLLYAGALGRGRLLAAPQPFTREALPALAEADFPQRLEPLLRAPLAAPDRARAEAVAPLRGAAVASGPVRPLDTALALLAALLFAAERLWAQRRRKPQP